MQNFLENIRINKTLPRNKKNKQFTLLHVRVSQTCPKPNKTQEHRNREARNTKKNPTQCRKYENIKKIQKKLNKIKKN